MTDSTPVIEAIPPPPPTSPGGLPVGDEPGIRDLILALRETVETRLATMEQRFEAVITGLKSMDGRVVDVEGDVRQLRSDLAEVRRTAQEARDLIGRASFDGEAKNEAMLAALTDTRGKLDDATKRLASAADAIATLQKTDEQIMTIAQQAAKDTAGGAIREVVGKNPRLIGAVIALLVVAANYIDRHYISAPNTTPAPIVMVKPQPDPVLVSDGGAP